MFEELRPFQLKRRFLMQGAMRKAFGYLIKETDPLPPLTLPEKILKLADSTTLLPLLRGQFDEDQYPGFDPKSIDMSNSCGQAVIATLANIYSSLNMDKRKITISDVLKLMNGKSGQMTHGEMNAVLKKMGKETELFDVVDNMTYFQEQKLIPLSEWNYVVERSRNEVFKKAGILVAFVLQYGRRPITKQGDVQGHFVAISGDKLLILDPRGGINNTAQVLNVSLENYSQPFINREFGLLSIQAVVPRSLGRPRGESSVY